MKVHRAGGAVAALAVLLIMGLPAPSGGATQAGAVRPSVVAVVGETGLNVLHEDFRTLDGRDPIYPAGMPRPKRIPLPGGSFESALERLQRGVLGHLEPGTLYALEGTRLLVYAPQDPHLPSSLFGESSALDDTNPLLHGTGVTDAAIGTRYGTAPDALAVFIPMSGPAAWSWIAAQPWIDVATTSGYVPSSDLCDSGDDVHRITRSGRVVFSSSGNTTDEAEPLMSPNGLPDVYQVGGVDSEGRTWRPGHPEESDPWFAAGNVTRPYDTGERYSFRAAAPDSYDGSVHFGGTSGATPLTAGWAATLIERARDLLDGKAGVPARGPLADGRFTRGELVDLLHHTATPAEPASPVRYLAEGYGAVDRSSIALATKVLQGTAREPARSEEDAAAAQVKEARRQAFAGRCEL